MESHQQPLLVTVWLSPPSLSFALFVCFFLAFPGVATPTFFAWCTLLVIFFGFLAALCGKHTQFLGKASAWLFVSGAYAS